MQIWLIMGKERCTYRDLHTWFMTSFLLVSMARQNRYIGRAYASTHPEWMGELADMSIYKRTSF